MTADVQTEDPKRVPVLQVVLDLRWPDRLIAGIARVAPPVSRERRHGGLGGKQASIESPPDGRGDRDEPLDTSTNPVGDRHGVLRPESLAEAAARSQGSPPDGSGPVRGSVSFAQDNGAARVRAGIATPHSSARFTWWVQGSSRWTSHIPPVCAVATGPNGHVGLILADVLRDQHVVRPRASV